MTIRKNISNILVGIAIFLLILVLFKTKDEIFIEEETHIGSRRVLIEKKNAVRVPR